MEGKSTKPKDLVRLIEGQRPTNEELAPLLQYVLGKYSPEKSQLLPIKWMKDTVAKAREFMSTGDEIKGLLTGYEVLDKTLRGIKPSEVIVVFGRTSEGKSQLAQNIALNFAKRGDPVMFIGLEMNDVENTARFLQMDKSEDLPIMYPDVENITYRELDSIVKTAKDKGAKLVILDHIHALSLPPADSRANQIEAGMYLLQAIGRKYEIPIMIVSHVNRTSQGMPDLSDLKGSGGLEQCASMAIALSRDRDHPTEIILAVRKNRNGPITLDEPIRLYVRDNLLITESAEWGLFPGVQTPKQEQTSY